MGSAGGPPGGHTDFEGRRYGTSRGGDMGPRGAAIWELEGRRTLDLRITPHY